MGVRTEAHPEGPEGPQGPPGADGADGIDFTRPMWSGTAVTDGGGNATFNFPVGLFAAPPVVTVEVQGGNGNAKLHKITTLSAASCTVNVVQSAGITLLGIGVLAVATPEAGVTVHVHAMPAG